MLWFRFWAGSESILKMFEFGFGVAFWLVGCWLLRRCWVRSGHWNPDPQSVQEMIHKPQEVSYGRHTVSHGSLVTCFVLKGGDWGLGSGVMGQGLAWGLGASGSGTWGLESFAFLNQWFSIGFTPLALMPHGGLLIWNLDFHSLGLDALWWTSDLDSRF